MNIILKYIDPASFVGVNIVWQIACHSMAALRLMRAVVVAAISYLLPRPLYQTIPIAG